MIDCISRTFRRLRAYFGKRSPPSFLAASSSSPSHCFSLFTRTGTTLADMKSQRHWRMTLSCLRLGQRTKDPIVDNDNRCCCCVSSIHLCRLTCYPKQTTCRTRVGHARELAEQGLPVATVHGYHAESARRDAPLSETAVATVEDSKSGTNRFFRISFQKRCFAQEDVWLVERALTCRNLRHG